MEEMLTDIKKHAQHYVILFVVLNLGIGLFYYLRFNPVYQTLVIISTSFAYVLWGILHHWLDGDLHLKVVWEYVLISLLVCLVAISLLIRA